MDRFGFIFQFFAHYHFFTLQFFDTFFIDRNHRLALCCDYTVQHLLCGLEGAKHVSTIGDLHRKPAEKGIIIAIPFAARRYFEAVLA